MKAAPNVRSSSRFNVNAFMNGYLTDLLGKPQQDKLQPGIAPNLPEPPPIPVMKCADISPYKGQQDLNKPAPQRDKKPDCKHYYDILEWPSSAEGAYMFYCRYCLDMKEKKPPGSSV